MINNSDTKLAINIGWRVSSPYITSEFPSVSWLQPSISHYVVVIEGSTIRGQLIEGIYPTATSSQSETAGTLEDLQLELKAWDAAADEDFIALESRLE